MNKAIELDSNVKTLKDELKEVQTVERMLNDAKSYLNDGKYTNALGEIKQVLRICPDMVEGKIRYIEILIKMGNVEQAISLCNENFSELASNVDFLYVRGLALCYNGSTYEFISFGFSNYL